jgi:hypothetical protein
LIVFCVGGDGLIYRKREVSEGFFFFFLFLFFFFFYQAREARKSGLMLFHEAMEEFSPFFLEQSFARFEKAAAKGHVESIWIGSVVKDVDMEETSLRETFATSKENPLGWYFLALQSYQRHL